MILMDGVLFDRDYEGEESLWPKALKILEALKKYRGAGSICWHQRVFCEEDFPGWAELYEKILDWVKTNDGWMGPCRDLVEHWNGMGDR